MGGREAESLLLDDLSIGSVEDLRRATSIARALVEEFGLGGEGVGVCRFSGDEKSRPLSPARLEQLDRRVCEILDEARRRAATILEASRPAVETLRDLLLEKKVIDARALASLAGAPAAGPEPLGPG
jgi:cell division protease FtsH